MKNPRHLQERSLAGAIRETVFSPFTGSVAKYAMILVLCSLPLYLMGYQNGSYGMLGWFLGFLLGGLAATAIVFFDSDDVDDDTAGVIVAGVLHRVSLVAVVIGVPIAGYAWFISGFEVISGSEWATSAATNTWAWVWKPLAQVCVVATAVILLTAKTMAHAIGAKRYRDDDGHYATSASAIFVSVCGVALIGLAAVPILGLFSAPLCSRFVLRIADGAAPVVA